MMNALSEIANLGAKRVILRLDLNVPYVEGKVADDFRIKRVLPTLDILAKNGARTLILSHIEGGATLKPVFDYISDKIKCFFAQNLEEAEKVFPNVQSGDFVMVENIRNEPGEQKNDPELAKRIAALGDVYVNEAFSVSHREHASVVGVPKIIPGYAGPVFMEEVEKLSESFNPFRPALFILGGAKFETKLPLVKKFLGLYDFVFIGGALANDLFKAKGLDVGASVVSGEQLDLDFILKSDKLYLPFDVTVNTASGTQIKRFNDVSSLDKIVDSGPRTSDELSRLISKSKFILWNGPLGQYEAGFSERTEDLARLIAGSGSKSIVGGGDTVAVVEKAGLLDKFSFVSTGGGAMLEFLAKGTLPGIEVLRKS